MSTIAHAPGRRRGRPPATGAAELDEAVLAVAREIDQAGRAVSKRALERRLGLSFKTVAASIDRLRAEGRWPYPEYHQALGFRKPTPRQSSDEGCPKALAKRLARFRAASAAKRQRTGCGLLTLAELIELFPDAPDGDVALEIKRGGAS